MSRRPELLELIDLAAGADGGESDFWTLDPIDGTMGFLRGDQYAVALALLKGGKPVLGVLGCPRLPAADHRGAPPTGALLYAVKGKGAYVSELVVQYRAMGFHYVAIGSDLGLLMRGAQAAVKALTTPEGETHVHTLSGGTQTSTGGY